jgi:fumarate reductase subunit D
MRRNEQAHRRDALWVAALIHRLSGVLLACFLPLHFLVLGLALRGEAALDGALKWTDNPLVKFAEMGLVFLLAVHLLGGLRVLATEMLPWRDGQRRLAFAAGGLAAVAAVAFALRVWA